jgi:hypothetical protein
MVRFFVPVKGLCIAITKTANDILGEMMLLARQKRLP